MNFHQGVLEKSQEKSQDEASKKVLSQILNTYLCGLIGGPCNISCLEF